MPEPSPSDAETVVVDGNNVMGAAADGWWRDPPAAVRRLVDRLRCYRQEGPGRMFLVLDVRQADLPEGHHDGVDVRYPERPGRNAADGRIVELLDELGGEVDGGPTAAITVVTSDRALAEAARQRGATVVGAGAFLARLRTAGC